MAEPTGLEPATSDVTGRRSNQLNYDSAKALPIFDCQFPILKKLSFSIGNRKSTIGNATGGRGGTRTPNLFLVREAVYH